MNLILGGTSGLGGEIAKELQARSEDTFVVGRTYSENKHGEGMAIDLAIETDVHHLATYIGTMALTGFYWVSGYGFQGDFGEQPDALKMAQVNFANVLPIAQAAWNKLLEEEGSSHFVVISSTSGVKARKDEAVYAGTKHAQVGFTRSLGLESERLNLNTRVSLFLPGGMQTGFWEGNEPEMLDEFLDPAKVAKKICDSLEAQEKHFYEETIERGSL